MTCERFGVEPAAARADERVGIAPNVRAGARPIKAVRNLPVDDMTGWYIWGGDIEASTQGDDFFVSLHVAHLAEWAPEIVPYLALPPGHGVIVEAGYEDVWFDAGYAVE
jgi:hypothetical protein